MRAYWKIIFVSVQLSACLTLAANAQKEVAKPAAVKPSEAGAVRYKVWAVLEKGNEVSKDQRAKVEKILSKRIVGHKVSVQSEGKDRLSVTIAGKPGDFTKVKLESLESAIKRQGRLSFQMAHEDYEEYQDKQLDPKKLPKGAKLLPIRSLDDDPDAEPRKLLVQEKVEFGSDQVRHIRASFVLNRWQLNLALRKKGAKRFYELSKEHNQRDHIDVRPFAIVLDGVVMSYPVFNEPIPGGNAQITGDFSEAEAYAIEASISNPLPISLNVLSKKFLPPKADK